MSGSLTLDLLVATMLVVAIGLAISVVAARYGRRYRLHRGIQIGLSVLLAIVLVAFEIDVRFVSDWRALAEDSPWFDPERFDLVEGALAVHLCFAIPTLFVWTATLLFALRRFGRKCEPGPFSPTHRFWGRVSAALMLLTVATGWVFYYLAFVATRET